MTRAPSELFAEVIRPAAEALGYKVFTNHMPDSPDKAIMVFDISSSNLEQRSMRGKVVEHPTVMVHTRGAKTPGASDDAYIAANSIWVWVSAVSLKHLSQGEILQCITKVNTIGSLGLEPQTRRPRYTQQFRMTILE